MSARDYYDRYWSEPGYCPCRDDVPESLRRLFEQHVTNTDECLDLGCGDGGTAGVFLAAHARSYLGVDVSEKALGLARKRGLSVRRIDDASDLPFPDSSFDVVVCSEVLEHLLMPHLAAAQALRVLRDNGRMIVTVPNIAYWRDRVDAVFGLWQPGGDDLGRAEPWRSPHIRFFTPASLRRMLLEVGFDRVDIAGVPVPILSRVPALRRLSHRPGHMAHAAASAFPSLLAGGVSAVATRNRVGQRAGIQ